MCASCATGKGPRHPTGASGRVNLGSVTVVPERAGVLELRFARTMVVDSRGRLVATLPSTVVRIRVGKSSQVLRAPTATAAPVKTSAFSAARSARKVDLDSDGAVANADAQAVVYRWTMRRYGAGSVRTRTYRRRRDRRRLRRRRRRPGGRRSPTPGRSRPSGSPCRSSTRCRPHPGPHGGVAAPGRRRGSRRHLDGPGARAWSRGSVRGWRRGSEQVDPLGRDRPGVGTPVCWTSATSTQPRPVTSAAMVPSCTDPRRSRAHRPAIDDGLGVRRSRRRRRSRGRPSARCVRRRRRRS